MAESSDVQHNKNRDFICPCAKSYLSYAALFTHIKQKHAGKVLPFVTIIGARKNHKAQTIEQEG
jgi:hypothetical protein